MNHENVILQISGMHCQACATRIEKILNKNSAVNKASVNYASEEAQINYNKNQITIPELVYIINQTGFEAKPKTNDMLDAVLGNTSASWRLIALWIFTLPFLISMFGMLTNQHQFMLPNWLQFILSTIVQLFLASPLYQSAFASIKGKLANMDVLVILGTFAIWSLSTVMFFFSVNPEHYMYFEANVMVISFISLGKYIESKTKHNSLNNLNYMLNLFPKTATILKDNQWISVPYQQITIGDFVKATIGKKICADGIVISGHAWIKESHLTGESLPVEKKIGATVLAGSVISDGIIVYKVTSLGKDTSLGDMINALNEAQTTKAPIARIADKVAEIFVPVVTIISLLTLLITYWITGQFSQALIHAVSVLIIACPCALGLATPAAIMVGMGIGSKNGIWFKNAAVIEASASIDTVVLDKTGTLTIGQPKVVDTWLNQDLNIKIQDLWQIAASIEQNSSHPLAVSIVKEALNKNISLLEAQEIKHEIGAGIEGMIPNLGKIKVGSLSYCQFELPEPLNPIWNISSIIAVSINHQAAGAFALSDPLKEDSYSAITQLQSKNIHTYLMSGDQQAVIDFLVDQVNIPKSHGFGNMTPRDKAHQINLLIKEGKKVAMVGDGINDAPALATATVGMAMGNSSDITNQTAGIILLHHSLSDVVNALHISKATTRNIKQNLFFAFGYNIIGIPLAAFGFLTPVISGIAMSLSSISVLINALRLKRIKLL